jgi:hydroxyethylthiazole kinase-like uncharacterized protein yjeF
MTSTSTECGDGRAPAVEGDWPASLAFSGLASIASVRATEAEALSRHPPGALMAAAADALADRVAHWARRQPVCAPIIALVGPGNNGGDALLAALILREKGFDARAWLLDTRSGDAADAAAVLRQARQSGMPLWEPEPMDPQDRGRADTRAVQDAVAERALWIDGLYGIGLTRPVEGRARDWIRFLNAARATVVAADVPSGIHADTGAVVGGAQGLALRCVETVSFIGDKPGLRTGAALDHVGTVTIATLGLAIDPVEGHWLIGPSPGTLSPLRRARNAHKGRQGTVRLLGGAPGMRGAVMLAARAAQRAGAGKVYLSLIDDSDGAPPLDPDWMVAPPQATVPGVSAIVVGCGMGQSASAEAALRSALEADCPVVVDADALNLIARSPGRLPARQASTLLTPHPLEAARLLKCSLDQILQDRITAAGALARDFRAFVILKGAGSVCSAPDGRWCVISSGSPALATAGSGDVLAGTVGALLAQGLSAWEALLWGAWAHGRAAERWSSATQHGGEIGLAASELPDWIRSTLNLEHAP